MKVSLFELMIITRTANQVLLVILDTQLCYNELQCKRRATVGMYGLRVLFTSNTSARYEHFR